MTTDEIMRMCRRLKASLREKIRKTAPSPAGYSELYLAEESPELKDVARQLCQAFLEGTSEQRDEIAFDFDDYNMIWWLTEFINAQTSAIRNSNDLMALRLGLAAVAIIGTRSGPLEIECWVGPLLRAAKAAEVSGWRKEFQSVGELAADVVTVAHQSGAYVKELIQTCPAIDDAEEERQRQKRAKREADPPPMP
jgi:hypothetical protein